MIKNTRFSSTLALTCCVAAVISSAQADEQKNEPIKVHNPKTLPAEISCERISVGVPGDYKPSIAVLPGGELLLTMFHQYDLKENVGERKRTIVELISLYRSTDGGETWTGPETLSLMGREPYLTVLKDGTVCITTHMHAADVRNDPGYSLSYLHRSTDSGKTWHSITIGREDVPGASKDTWVMTSRNVLELEDGMLILGVSGTHGRDYLWRSTDKGKSWDKTLASEFGSVDKTKIWYGFLGETVYWQARSGKVLALVRVDSHAFPATRKLANATGTDNDDYEIIWGSTDEGRTFQKVGALGDYGQMYPSLLRLQDGRLLYTYTQRSQDPPLGVRAIVLSEKENGFTFDFDADRLLIDYKSGSRSGGGGFGPTVQLKDGTLVTSYTYRGEDSKTHAEVVRWRLPTQKNGTP